MIQAQIRELAAGQLTEEEINSFVKLGKTQSVGKYNYLHQQGKVMDRLFFCKKGILAVVHQHEDKELVKQFVVEGRFFPVIFSLIARAPSAVALKFIEEGEVISWDYNLLKQLMGKNPAWHTFLDGILRRNYCLKEQKETIFLKTTPKERYLQLIEHYPVIAARVPLHYIASYLGVSAETLSRIRARRIQTKKVFLLDLCQEVLLK